MCLSKTDKTTSIHLYEYFRLNQCNYIITDLVLGYDLLTFQETYKNYFTEVEARNMLSKIILAVQSLQTENMKIVHRDFHS